MDGPWRAPFEQAQQRNAPQVEVQLATVSPEGLPFVRTVDLRGVSAEGHLFVFTDSRSRKADHLRTTPRLMLLAWFPKTQEQWLLSGRVALHGVRAEEPWAAVRARAWAQLEASDRLRYVGPPPGFAYVEAGRVPVPREAPPEFLVVSLDVAEADWLTHGPPRRRLSWRLLGPSWVEQAITP